MWLLTSAVALASTVSSSVPLSQRLQAAPLVVEGLVVDQWNIWDPMSSDRFFLVSRVRVTRTLQGSVETGEVLIPAARGCDPDGGNRCFEISCNTHVEIGERVRVVGHEIVQDELLRPAMLAVKGDSEWRRILSATVRGRGQGVATRGYDAALHPKPPPPPPPGKLELTVLLGGEPASVQATLTSPSWHQRRALSGRPEATPPGVWSAEVRGQGVCASASGIEVVSGALTKHTLEMKPCP